MQNGNHRGGILGDHPAKLYGLQFSYVSIRDGVYDFYSFQHILFMTVIQNVSSIETNTDSILEIFNAIEKMRCKG
jgi:hypothetical protein